MKPYSRSERVSAKIQHAISDLLKKKISNPSIEMATITGVKMTDDLRIAYVYITIFGDQKKSTRALNGFKRSAGFIKKTIAPGLGLKYMPDLKFMFDDSFDRAARMDALIEDAVKDIPESSE